VGEEFLLPSLLPKISQVSVTLPPNCIRSEAMHLDQLYFIEEETGPKRWLPLREHTACSADETRSQGCLPALGSFHRWSAHAGLAETWLSALLLSDPGVGWVNSLSQSTGLSHSSP
jgi:hypothetical protein